MKIHFVGQISLPGCGEDGSGLDAAFVRKHGLEDEGCTLAARALAPAESRPDVWFFTDPRRAADGEEPATGWVLAFGPAKGAWSPADILPGLEARRSALEKTVKFSGASLWYSSFDFQAALQAAAGSAREEQAIAALAAACAPGWPREGHAGALRAGAGFTATAELLPELDAGWRTRLGLGSAIRVAGTAGIDGAGHFVALTGAVSGASVMLLEDRLKLALTAVSLRVEGLDPPAPAAGEGDEASAKPGGLAVDVSFSGTLSVEGRVLDATLRLSRNAAFAHLLVTSRTPPDCAGWLQSLLPGLRTGLSPLGALAEKWTPTLQRLEVTVPLRGGGSSRASLRLGYGADFELFDGLVRLRPWLQVETDFSADGTRLALAGTWTVAAATPEEAAQFDVSLTLPACDVYAGLAAGSRLKLAKPLEDLLAPLCKGQSGLVLLDLELSGNLRTGACAITIVTEGFFSIPVGDTVVRLGEVVLDVTREANEWQVAFGAVLGIGRHTVALAAQVATGPDAGMAFSLCLPSVSLAELAQDLLHVAVPAELAAVRIADCLMALEVGARTRFSFSAATDSAVTIGGLSIHLQQFRVEYNGGTQKPLTLAAQAQLRAGSTVLEAKLSLEGGVWRIACDVKTDFDVAALLAPAAAAIGFELPFAAGDIVVRGFTLDLRLGGGVRLAMRCNLMAGGKPCHMVLVARRPSGGEGGWQHFLQIGAPPVDFLSLPLIGAPLKTVAGAAARARGGPPGDAAARLENIAFRLADPFAAGPLATLFEGLDDKDFPRPGTLGGKASLHGDIVLPDWRRALDFPTLPKDDAPTADGRPAAEKKAPAGQDAGVSGKGQGAEAPGKDQGAGAPENGRDAAASLKSKGADAPADGKGTPAAPAAIAFPAPAGAARGWWLAVDRSLGPVTLERIGVSPRGGEVDLMIDASARFGPARLSLIGLTATLPLKLPPRPRFSLRGVSVSATTRALTLSGGLMEIETGRYSGAVMLGFGKVSLTALGSYAEIADGAGGTVPSIAVFAVLTAPLGGPPAFYVTGLAGGIGHNRAWKNLPLAEIGTHPLLQAMDGDAGGSTISGLDTVSPPQKGSQWVAVGVRFTSFRIINGIGLLALSLGEETRISLLARLDIVFPPRLAAAPAPGKPEKGGVPTLLSARILVQAEYRPATGELKVDGMLAPGSFLLDEKATISGGFALYCWFAPSQHAGDFVLTLGGYHPRFRPPAHYPRVERLALNWKVSDAAQIKGEHYFALTPAAIMAGGLLEVDYRAGWGSASFRAQADFIIFFQPFSYSARIGVAVHVEAEISLWPLTLKLALDLAVSLEVWGPPFGALARVSFHGLTKDIELGATARPSRLPVGWAEFRRTFLPAANAGERGGALPPAQPGATTATDSLITFDVSGGLVARLDPVTGNRRPAGAAAPAGPQDWLIDPGALKLAAGFNIPTRQIRLGETRRRGSEAFGVGPMALQPADFDVAVELVFSAAADWTLRETAGAVPAGLWRPPGEGLPQEQTIAGVLTGVELTPVVRQPPGCAPARALRAEGTVRHAWWVRATRPPPARDPDMATLRATLADPATQARRQKVLDAVTAVSADIDRRLAARDAGTGPRPAPAALPAPARLAAFAGAAQLLLTAPPQIASEAAA